MNTTNNGSPTELAELVDYQADAIVSVVLTKSKAGSVTLFAFDREQELSEHTTPFEALVYLVDGVAEIGIDGRPHPVSVGQLIRLPPNVPHWVRALERFKMLLIMLREPPE
jgi:quercetin dioxygenase-like cupin family protein